MLAREARGMMSCPLITVVMLSFHFFPLLPGGDLVGVISLPFKSSFVSQDNREMGFLQISKFDY